MIDNNNGYSTFRDVSDYLDAVRDEHSIARARGLAACPFSALAGDGHEREAFVLALACSTASDFCQLYAALRMARMLDDRMPEYGVWLAGRYFWAYQGEMPTIEHGCTLPDGELDASLYPALREHAEVYLAILADDDSPCETCQRPGFGRICPDCYDRDRRDAEAHEADHMPGKV